MANIFENPEQFKAQLKDKWLDYYEVNKYWLQRLIREDGQWSKKVECKEKFEYAKDGYHPCRPNSYLLLGIISAIEPQLKGLLSFVSAHDPDLIIKNLGLDFDPKIELKKRSQQKSLQQETTSSEYLEEIRKEIKT